MGKKSKATNTTEDCANSTETTQTTDCSGGCKKGKKGGNC